MAGHADGRRRYVIVAGTSRYIDEAIPDLPGVRADVDAVTRLFSDLGYERILPELAVDPTADDLQDGIEQWLHDPGRREDDVVVVYYAGHGIRVAGQHLLQCHTSRHELTGRALPTATLARVLHGSPVRDVLVVLDTCFAGVGAGEIAGVAYDLAAVRPPDADGPWLLAAARARDEAEDGAFVAALTAALTEPSAGDRQPYQDIHALTERINVYLAAHHPQQRARCGVVDSAGGLPPFFPNTGYLPDLPDQPLDVETQRHIETLRRIRRERLAHFGPRARGVETAAETGSYFTGRLTALREIAAWLAAPVQGSRTCVVTGAPGSGKSALLGRILDLCETEAGSPFPGLPPETVPPPGCIDLPLHARGATLEELAGRIAAHLRIQAVTHEELLTALRERDTPLTLLVDALDEAGGAGNQREAGRVAGELLRPLADIPSVRMLIGTRTGPIASLGAAVQIINLDDHTYIGEGDISAYVRRVLLPKDDPASPTPYRDRTALASNVARGVARRAGRSYLVARMITRALVHSPGIIDTEDADWAGRLPSEAGQAFDAYLSWFGGDEPRVRRLLLPLAYAAGEGLPWDDLWAPVAAAVAGEPCSDQDIGWLLQHAGPYIVETRSDSGRSAFRLFHEALAEHLRDPRRDAEVYRRLTGALLARVPAAPGTGRDWQAAHPYILSHLATYAAAAGTLDPLLAEAEFLVHADPPALLAALDTAGGEDARLSAAIYRLSVGRHLHASTLGRRQVLAVDAARFQASALASALAQTLDWRPRWATGSQTSTALRATLVGHGDPVLAVACSAVDARPVAVTGGGKRSPRRGDSPGDYAVRVWDLATGALRATLAGHASPVAAVACTTLNDGRPVAVTGGCEIAILNVPYHGDYAVRVWDLATRTLHATLAGHTEAVREIACTTVNGRSLAVTVGRHRQSGEVRVWDLATGTEYANLTGHASEVAAVACTSVDGRPVAITGGGRTESGGEQGDSRGDCALRVWDLATRSLHTTLAGHTGPVRAIACATVNGRPVAVTAAVWWSGAASPVISEVRVWDLASGTLHSILPVPADCDVYTVACATLNGRAVAITGAKDLEQKPLTQVWDLDTGTLQATMTGGPRIICAAIDHRPVILGYGHDDAVRVFDLTTGSLRATFPSSSGPVSCTIVDGQPVAVTGTHDYAMGVWDMNAVTPSATSAGHAGTVTTVACASVNGQPLTVTSGADQTVRVWDLATGTLHTTLTGHTSPIWRVACATVGGRPIVIGSGDHFRQQGRQEGRVWDLPTGTLHTTLTDRIRPTGDIACAIDGNGQPVAVFGSGYVHVHDLNTGTLRATLNAGDSRSGDYPYLTVAATAAAGRLFVLAVGGRAGGHEGCKVRVWDAATGTLHTTFTDHTGGVKAVACIAVNRNHFAVTGSDGHDGRPTVHVWDLATGDQRASFTGHTDTVTAVTCTIIRGRPVAVTGSDDGTVRMWDLASMKPLCPAIMLPFPVHDLAIGPATELVIVGGWEVVVLEPHGP